VNGNRRPLGFERTVTHRGGAELKQARAVRTRAQVLAAAAEAFADRGFPAVTVLEVAERAGVTKGAVYFHYPNKETPAFAVVEEFYTRWPAVADAVRRLRLPPLESVIEILTRTAVSFRDDKVVQAGARLQIERHFIDTGLPLPYVDYTDLITELLDRAKIAGQLRVGTDPQCVARVLVSAFFGTQHISWVLNDRADITDRVRDELHPGVRPTPGETLADRAGRSRTPSA
jgi:AcrR family transcriptional regulator